MDKRAAAAFTVSFVLLFVFSCATTTSLQAEDNKAVTSEQKITAFDQQLSWVEDAFVSAAEAMPEDKYSFVPEHGEFKGVRNFGQLIKHAAGNNFLLFAAILQDSHPPADPGANGDGLDNMTSKTEIVKYLKDCFAYGHKAYQTLNSTNFSENYKSPLGPNGSKMGMSLAAITHTWDMYGQVVEYLRMNNIVPPASRSK